MVTWEFRLTLKDDDRDGLPLAIHIPIHSPTGTNPRLGRALLQKMIESGVEAMLEAYEAGFIVRTGEVRSVWSEEKQTWVSVSEAEEALPPGDDAPMEVA